MTPNGTVVNLIHGEQHRVMLIRHAVDAEGGLRQLGAQVSLDCIPGLEHGMDARIVEASPIHSSATNRRPTRRLSGRSTRLRTHSRRPICATRTVVNCLRRIYYFGLDYPFWQRRQSAPTEGWRRGLADLA